MSESKIKDGNYVTIQSFMVKDLGLKGNDLLIYAIIYGFSQDYENCFSGSLQYLADWTNSTKPGVIKNLKNLVEKGYIEKIETSKNGVRFTEYKIKEVNTIKQSLMGVKQSLTEDSKQSLMGVKQSLPNNIEYNTKLDKDSIEYIVGFLNSQSGKNYKSSVQKTINLIKARLNEGFTVDDFKTVISNKCAEWKGTEMDKYLRPETLFGTKFEGYLNSKCNSKQSKFYTENNDPEGFWEKWGQ